MTSSDRPTTERVRGFLQWFESLDSEEQEVLMTLVYKEKKVRDVVVSLASMAQDQRQEVFQRLGLRKKFCLVYRLRTLRLLLILRSNGKSGSLLEFRF